MFTALTHLASVVYAEEKGEKMSFLQKLGLVPKKKRHAKKKKRTHRRTPPRGKNGKFKKRK